MPKLSKPEVTLKEVTPIEDSTFFGRIQKALIEGFKGTSNSKTAEQNLAAKRDKVGFFASPPGPKEETVEKKEPMLHKNI